MKYQLAITDSGMVRPYKIGTIARRCYSFSDKPIPYKFCTVAVKYNGELWRIGPYKMMLRRMEGITK